MESRKKLKLLLLLCSLFFINMNVFSQNREESESIEISKEMFDRVKLWQEAGRNQRVPLDQYLQNYYTTNDTVSLIVNKLRESSRTKKTSCGCITLNVNSSYEMAPASGGVYYPYEDQGGLTTWARTNINGASSVQRLYLNSMDGNTDYEYSNIINNQTGSTTAHARMSFNYLCTNGSLLPEDCGCDKTIYVKSGYYGYGSVYTEVGGILNNRFSRGSVDDASVLVKIDQYQSTTDLAVLKAGSMLVSRWQHEQWNPQAWSNYLNLAASVTGVVVSVVGGAPLPPLGNIADQIAAAANTPTIIQLGSNDTNGTAEGNFAVNYDGGITLSPNHIVTIQMVSSTRVFAKGNKKYRSHVNRTSDFYISAVLPFNDSNPECCMEKYAKWVSASSGGYGVQAYGNTGLRNGISSHVTLWSPWNNLFDSNGDGNIDINTSIGYGNNSKECIVCGLDPITGMSVRANGLNINSNTRPAIFTWNGQMNVSNYVLYIYNASGVLIHTITTSSPPVTVNLAPGNYSFKVKANCENGSSTTSGLTNFEVKELYAEQDPRDLSFGKTGVSNQLILYPNPTKENTVIQVDKSEKILSYTIYDNTGMVVKTEKITGAFHEKSIQLSDVRKGFYLITVETNKQVYKEKLIKE